MPECFLCESHEAVIEDLPYGNRVQCPSCRVYMMTNALLADLPSDPEWPRIRHDLSRCVRWQSYRGNPLNLLDLAQIRIAIDGFLVFEADSEERERLAVAALRSRGRPRGEQWAADVLHSVSKALGLSPEEARLVVEDLMARNIVRFECHSDEDVSPLPGAEPLPRLGNWVKCDE